MPSSGSEQDVPSHKSSEKASSRQVSSQQSAGVFSSLKAAFIELMLNWPKTILSGFLILVAILGWQARDFEIDASPDTLLTQGNDLYIQTQDVNQRYAPQEFLLLTYEPTAHELYSEDTFSDVRALTDAVLAMDRVESVRNMLNVPLFANVDDVKDVSGDLDNTTINDGDFQMQQIEEEFAEHPVYADLLVNREQSATALQILFRTDERLQKLNGRINALNSATVERELSPQEQQELDTLLAEREPIEQALKRIRIDEIDQLRALAVDYAEEADIRLGGVHVIAYQLIEIISNDLVIFGAAIAVMICLVLLLLFRSLRWILIPVLCLLILGVGMMDESFRDDLTGSFFDEDNNPVRFNIWVEDLTEGLNRSELLQSVRTDMSEPGIDNAAGAVS